MMHTEKMKTDSTRFQLPSNSFYCFLHKLIFLLNTHVLDIEFLHRCISHYLLFHTMDEVMHYAVHTTKIKHTLNMIYKIFALPTYQDYAKLHLPMHFYEIH